MFCHKRQSASDTPKLGESLNIRPLIPRSIQGAEILPKHVPYRKPFGENISAPQLPNRGNMRGQRKNFPSCPLKIPLMYSPKFCPWPSVNVPYKWPKFGARSGHSFWARKKCGLSEWQGTASRNSSSSEIAWHSSHTSLVTVDWWQVSRRLGDDRQRRPVLDWCRQCQRRKPARRSTQWRQRRPERRQLDVVRVPSSCRRWTECANDCWPRWSCSGQLHLRTRSSRLTPRRRLAANVVQIRDWFVSQTNIYIAARRKFLSFLLSYSVENNLTPPPVTVFTDLLFRRNDAVMFVFCSIWKYVPQF